MVVAGTSLEVLAPAECVRLLAAERIGRIGITVNALPVIVPVRYVLDGDEILFRATRGGALDTGTRRTVIAFEADGIEPGVGAWSVMATGMARHLAADDGRDRDLVAGVVLGLRSVGRADAAADLRSAADRVAVRVGSAARAAALPDGPQIGTSVTGGRHPRGSR